MSPDKLQTKLRWVCETFFPEWECAGWQAVFVDMPVIAGLVHSDTKRIDVARRFAGAIEITAILVHEVAHAARQTKEHSARWREAVLEASRIAEKRGQRDLAAKLKREAKHWGVTDSAENFYGFVASQAREYPGISAEDFLEHLSKAFQTDKVDLLAEFPLTRRRFNEAKALATKDDPG